MKKSCLVILAITLTMGCGEGGADPVRDGAVVRDGGTDATGALTCEAVLGCVDACDDDPCVAACVVAATPAAALEIEALVECSSLAGCGDDDACIESACAAEVAACRGGSRDAGMITDDASTGFPTRIEGTSRDFTAFPGTTTTIDSTATLVFVRDDAAGAAAGFPDSMVFYRLHTATYRAVFSGVDVCTTTADATETFTDPPAFENHLVMERAPGGDGLHAYWVSTTLSVHHANGLVSTCPPPIPSTTGIFNAEHNLTSGTVNPRGDGAVFVGTATVSFREFSWDLRAVD